MFFNCQHLNEWGYEPINSPFRDKKCLYNYAKEFPENNSIVFYSALNNNRVETVLLSEENFNLYKSGKAAVTDNLKKIKTEKTLSGDPYVYGKIIIVFDGGELKNRKELKAYINKAEEIAKSNMLVRDKVIEV